MRVEIRNTLLLVCGSSDSGVPRFVDLVDHPAEEALITVATGFLDRHGGEWSEWPMDLRVREIPGGKWTALWIRDRIRIAGGANPFKGVYVPSEGESNLPFGAFWAAAELQGELCARHKGGESAMLWPFGDVEPDHPAGLRKENGKSQAPGIFVQLITYDSWSRATYETVRRAITYRAELQAVD